MSRSMTKPAKWPCVPRLGGFRGWSESSLGAQVGFVMVRFIFEPLQDKPNKMFCAPSKDLASDKSDPSSLCTLWIAKDPKTSSGGQQRPIRLSGCPGWYESSLGTQVIILVLSCSSSFFIVSGSSIQTIYLMARRWSCITWNNQVDC